MEKEQSSHNRKMERLSSASAAKYNNPYWIKGSNVEGSNIKSIDWDNPDWEVSLDDPRWILPENFDLGAHHWYQELPDEQKIEIGMKRIANVTRTGLEFEQALLSGIALRNQILTSPKHYDEFRYMGHEATEEQHHILMFNEMIHRIGMKTYGSPKWFRNLITPFTGVAAQKAPMAFYQSVLAGEEPIDRVQRNLVNLVDKGEADIHPMVYRVMKVHIEEEARHIGAAEELLQKYLPYLGERQLKLFAKIYPAITRAGINATLVPSKETLEYMDIPEWVAKETWFDSDHGRQTIQDLSLKARKRAEKLGLRDEKLLGKLGKRAWEMSGVDGPTTRS